MPSTFDSSGGRALPARIADGEQAGAYRTAPAVTALPQGGPDPYHEALAQVWRRRAPILLAGLAIGAASALLASQMTPKYQAASVLLIEGGRPTVLDINDIRQPGDDRVRFFAQLESLQSRTVAERTVRTLRLQDDPYLDPRRPPSSLPGRARAAVTSTLAGLIGDAPVEWTDEGRIDAVTRVLMHDVKVVGQRTSGTVAVSYSYPDPARAAAIVNAYVQAYVDADHDSRLGQSRKVSAMLRERLDELQRNVAASERTLQAYRDEHGVVDVGDSSDLPLAEQLKEATRALADAVARRSQLEGVHQQLQRLPASQRAGLPAVQRDPGVIDAQRQVGQAQAELAALSQSAGTSHPSVLRAREQLAAARRTLDAQRAAVVDGIDRDYRSAQATERQMRAFLDGARGDARDANRTGFRLAELQRDVQTNRELYDKFRERARETDVAGEVQEPVARVIDPALPPDRPSSPKVLLSGALGMGLAWFAGIVWVALRTLFARAPREVEAEQLLGLTVLGALPSVGGAPSRAPLQQMFAQPASLYAERMRSLRTAIQLSTLDDERRALLVVSCRAGDGKSSVAANLAEAQSLVGRTLLIDGDLRRHALGASFGLAQNAPGLSDLLAGDAPAGQCVHRIGDGDLYLLPAGTPVPNPLEMLMSRRFRTLFDSLRAQYDYVVVDSPALEAVSDGFVLASIVPTTLVVVRNQGAGYQAIARAVARLRQTRTALAGLVLNGTDDGNDNPYQGRYGDMALARPNAGRSLPGHGAGQASAHPDAPAGTA